jgi:NAD(P)-dependent dehydrogenase (short-subunit alcohol dehydrogenase family)
MVPGDLTRDGGSDRRELIAVAATSRGAALVIGGSGGLGRDICRRVAKDWQSVFLTYRSRREAAVALCGELSPLCAVECAALDLHSESSIDGVVKEAIARFDAIGTLIFAAGSSILQPYVVDISEQQWLEVFQTELLGFTRLVRAVLPVFRRQGHGNFVAVVSFATYSFPPGDALSAVPKAGIEMLCRAIAKEEGRYGIRANSVAPGIINAGLGEQFQQSLFNPTVWAEQRRRVPLKRFGEGAEVADAVAYLASEQSSYVTGQTIIIDGGLRL